MVKPLYKKCVLISPNNQKHLQRPTEQLSNQKSQKPTKVETRKVHHQEINLIHTKG